MEVFCKFRTVKRILKAVVVGLILANAERIYANTYYTWTGNGSNTNWENHENWQKYTGTPVTEYNESQGTLYSIITSTDWTDAAEGEYPKTEDDRIFFTGQNTANVKLNASITVDSIFFNSLADKTITIDLNSNNIFCMLKILLVAQSNYITDSNVIIKGAGSFSADTFDFPSNGTHKFAVQDETTTVIIRNTLWANSSGTLLFSGNGYLYMPNGGPNVNYGASNIQYEIESSHRRPFEDGTPTYICETSIPDESTPNGATVTFTKGLPNEGSVGIKFPYSVTIVGSGTYTLNGVTLHNGDVYTGNTAASAEQGTSNLIVAGSTGVPSKTYTLTCTNPPTTTGAGITICFYSPDGQLPSDSTDAGTKSFMEIGRISWYYKKPTWTGAVNSDWTNEGNWTGISEVSDLRNLSAYDIEISVPATSSFYTPVITEDIAVGSLTITGGSKVTHKSGKFSTNKIVTTGTGKFISEKNIYGAYNCTVELVKFYDLQEGPTLVRAFSDSITLGNLSIAEGATFTMPFDMDLGMLTINSGSGFYKNGKNLSLGWLQVQTANYSTLSNMSKHIYLADDFEADSIIILLRDGNITATGNLSAKKDFIIGGANYNYSNYKYEDFINRPDGWIHSFTDTISLDIKSGDPRTEDSTFYLSDGADIKAGTSGEGNFFIGGAKLVGESSNNKIIIPQNDSAEHFCAYSINSTIRNITVACSDGTKDGEHAQIPVGGGSVDSSCKNFDKEDFKIASAETVFDNRIKITMNREARNTHGELNDSKVINAIKVSDGNYFTNTYNSADGTEEPEATPEVFYIYTNKTSWNMDATGDMDPATVADVCNYTNSTANWRSVVPYLVIPQKTASCGYTITDKWGKHINDYNAYTGTTDGTDKTPTWSGQYDSVWENTWNWYNLNKNNTLEESLALYGTIIKPTENKPVISTKTINPTGQSWNLKSLTIEQNASITIKDEGAVITSSITNKGTLNQTGGLLQLTGTSASITAETDATTTITNLELMTDTKFTAGSDLSVNNLILNGGVEITTGTNTLTATNITITADDKPLEFTNSYSAENIYIKSGPVNIPGSVSAKNILAYGGTINLTTASSVLNATNDFIILGTGYGESFNYNHFAARPAGWIGVNIPPADIGKLPDGTTITEFSANVTAAAGATLSAGTSTTAGESKNLYINKATLTGTGEWFITIPQNDDGAKICTEAIDSSFTYCTVKCTDGTANGTHAQIPLGNSTTDSHCKNFDKSAFQITAAETVADNRVKITLSAPARNNHGELNNAEVLNNIKVSDGNCFTNAYKTKEGTEPPDAMPEEFYIYTSTTSWNTDATGTSIGSGKYTNSQDVFRKVKPCLTIPQYTINEDGSVKCGFIITDKWGKRLMNYDPFTAVADGIPDSEKHRRSPPQFGTVLCPVGSNKISFSFTRPIVIDKNKIVYRTNVGSPTSIRENMDVLLAHCFELISIDAEGRAIPTDLQINKNKKAKIDQYPSGLVVVTLQLTRNATLEDIEKLYIRLTTPKDDAGDEMYDSTTYDHVSMTLGTNQVSFIQEPNKETGDGTTFMLINTAHAISDFAINAVTPSYAYTDVTKNIYDSDSIAVHDFSKNQQNYGTLPYGYEFTLISKINLGTKSTEESDYPGKLKLFITDSPDAQSIFTTFNANFNKSVTTWLPESTVNSYSVDAFDAYTKKLNPHFWDIPGSPISTGTPSSGFNFIVPKETVTKMKSGSQLSFLYALCDENGTFIPHYLSPDCNYTSDPVTYTLPESTKVPLFAFNITNANDLLSLDQWYIKLKNITQQRGGVTILNNVINAAAGEKTTLKVNMAESGKLDVIVMTLDGNIITYLNRGNVSAGEHFYSWDGKNKAGSPVARGMYFIIVKAPGMDETRKVMVVK